MKYQEIKEKHQKAYNAIIDKHGVFWVFGLEQLNAKLKELNLKKEDLATFAGGGILPKKNAKKLYEELEKADEAQLKELKKLAEDEEQKEKAILYELNNYECFYSGELENVFDIFQDIFTKDDITKVYNKHNN